MTCESSLRPKKYSIALDTVFELIRFFGVRFSCIVMLSRSRIERFRRRKPLRTSSPASSSIVRTRRLPRWSMSSGVPSFRRIFMMYFTELTTSSFWTVISDSGTFMLNLRFRRKRPTRPSR